MQKYVIGKIIDACHHLVIYYCLKKYVHPLQIACMILKHKNAENLQNVVI